MLVMLRRFLMLLGAFSARSLSHLRLGVLNRGVSLSFLCDCNTFVISVFTEFFARLATAARDFFHEIRPQFDGIFQTQFPRWSLDAASGLSFSFRFPQEVYLGQSQ